MANKRTSLDDFPANFRISLEERVRAAHGLPAHIRRKRRIEDLEEATVLALAEILDEAEAELGKGSEAADRALVQGARDVDLSLLNDLIERHNRYYPIEANLPIDVKTGKLMLQGRRWEPLAKVTIEALIERVRKTR